MFVSVSLFILSLWIFSRAHTKIIIHICLFLFLFFLWAYEYSKDLDYHSWCLFLFPLVTHSQSYWEDQSKRLFRLLTSKPKNPGIPLLVYSIGEDLPSSWHAQCQSSLKVASLQAEGYVSEVHLSTFSGNLRQADMEARVSILWKSRYDEYAMLWYCYDEYDGWGYTHVHSYLICINLILL